MLLHFIPTFLKPFCEEHTETELIETPLEDRTSECEHLGCELVCTSDSTSALVILSHSACMQCFLVIGPILLTKRFQRIGHLLTHCSANTLLDGVQ